MKADCLLLAHTPLVLGICLGALSACGSNGRPSSLVSGGGASGASGHESQGGRSGEAGQGFGGSADAGESGEGGSGEGGGFVDGPSASFKAELTVDATCGKTAAATDLRIGNDGTTALQITSASADSGYTISTSLPLSIAPSMVAIVQVVPPAPAADTKLGAMSTGTLSFVTNEAGTPTHRVKLQTTLYGAELAFADSDGNTLTGALPLTYIGDAACPQTATYRVLNTGNVGVNLLGPTFPAHFGGVTTGTNGATIAPGEYTELKVGAVSAPDGACSASGALTFSVAGALCGAVPSLTVTWTDNGAGSCTCVAPTP